MLDVSCGHFAWEGLVIHVEVVPDGMQLLSGRTHLAFLNMCRLIKHLSGLPYMAHGCKD